MASNSHSTVTLFDKYTLLIPQKLDWYQDGLPGQRILFISDQKKAFTVSFVENMKLMDMLPNAEGVSTVSYQCCQDGKYIHFKRNSSGRITCAFFHMELEDSGGQLHYLPGQMLVNNGYPWSDGIEPVLMQILDGVSLSEIADAFRH